MIAFTEQGDSWVECALDGIMVASLRLERAENRWLIAEVRVLNPSNDSLRRLPLGRITAAVNASPAFFVKGESPHERLRLTRPKSRRLRASFYQQVAAAYRDAVRDGLAPRQTLASDTGSAPDTVARWVGEARRRHFLPETTQGKVTA